MMIINIIITLLLPLQLICSKYDHLLYENFELTKRTFIEEQVIFQNTRHLKNIINLMFSEVESNIGNASNTVHQTTNKHNQPIMYTTSIDYNNMKKLKEASNNIKCSFFATKKLQSSYLRYRNLRNNFSYSYGFEKVYSNIPRTQLLVAALKGVIMLQDTYGPDIKHFSRGELNLKKNIFIKSRSNDALQVDDLLSMSGIAFNELHWYDSSIRYLKQAIDELFSNTRKVYNSSFFERFLQECLTSMKKWYSSYHNELLHKMGNPIGMDYKLLPLRINEGKRLRVLHLWFDVKYHMLCCIGN